MERLLEAYSMDDDVFESNNRIKKLLDIIIVIAIIAAFILFTLYLCTAKVLDPTLKLIRKLLLAFVPVFFFSALILLIVRLHFKGKTSHYVEDVHDEIYDQMVLMTCKTIEEDSDHIEGGDGILDSAYRKYIRSFLLKVFTENGKVTNQSCYLIENYANYLYDMHNYELSCIFRRFMDEFYS